MSGAPAGAGQPLQLVEWLGLAASPTFALMALATRFGDAPELLCSAVNGSSPLGGMVPMYLLMSAFHAAPWLKLMHHARGH
jgi:hypothetical protein